jgi:hypothetical protein
MRKRGMAWWVAGQQGLEKKSEKPLKSFEEPSKNHRSSFVTSRLHHASCALAAGWVVAERAGAAP